MGSQLETQYFSVTVILHQGSELSPYLLKLVIDELTNTIQDEVICCMLYAYDIVLIEKTNDTVNQKHELWRSTLKEGVLR